MSTSGTGSRLAVARAHQLLTHATELLADGVDEGIDSLTALGISTLQLRTFALLGPDPIAPPAAAFPADVREAVCQAAEQTAAWDQGSLPVAATDVATTLCDLAAALRLRRAQS